mgnify:CR=1 FL=1
MDIANLVQATAGREQGKYFFILETEGEYLLLADGKSRRLEKPKRKKRKHIEQIPRTESRIAEKIRNGDKVLNSELRRELAVIGQTFNSQNQGG